MAIQAVSAGQRQQMIAEAAYFRAERYGFNRRDRTVNWLEAEAEVDARLSQMQDDETHLRRPSHTLKEQAEDTWDDIREVIERMGRAARPRR